jgi:hypothetical protein
VRHVITPIQLEEFVFEVIEGQMDDIGARLIAEVDARGLLADGFDRQLLVPLRRAATAELHAGMRAFSLDRRLPDAPPAETGDLARQAARARVPLATLIRVYMIALGVYWEAIFDAILTSEAATAVQNDLVRVGTRFLQEFVAHISGLAADEYSDERDRTVRRRTLRRLATVRDILAGTASSGAELDYDLTRMHCGIVATGAGAEDVLASAREGSGLTVLAVPDDDTVWAWMAGDAGALAVAQRALATAATENVRIGVGRIQTGLDGFRVTHRQALAAHALAASLGRPVVTHRDVALETLAGGGGSSAAQFIKDELGPLMAPPRDRLLPTLSAYLTMGQNGTAAAAALKVSARTVSHRLFLVEEALGHPVAERAVELNTALRLHALTGEHSIPARTR